MTGPRRSFICKCLNYIRQLSPELFLGLPLLDSANVGSTSSSCDIGAHWQSGQPFVSFLKPASQCFLQRLNLPHRIAALAPSEHRHRSHPSLFLTNPFGQYMRQIGWFSGQRRATSVAHSHISQPCSSLAYPSRQYIRQVTEGQLC